MRESSYLQYTYQDVLCPFCKAVVGEPCWKMRGNDAGRPADWAHLARITPWHRWRRGE